MASEVQQVHRHRFAGDGVLAEVQRWAPVDVAEFVDLLTALSEDPFPGGHIPGVFELKAGGVPSNTYTVAFDHALLVYQVMGNAPVIKLIQVTRL
jgi:hypothetical protein